MRGDSGRRMGGTWRQKELGGGARGPSWAMVGAGGAERRSWAMVVAVGLGDFGSFGGEMKNGMGKIHYVPRHEVS